MNHKIGFALGRYQIRVFVIDLFEKVHQMSFYVHFAFLFVDAIQQGYVVGFKSVYPVTVAGL